MSKRDQILDEISTLPLNEQSEIAKLLLEQISFRARRSVRPGTKVYFSTRSGVRIEGTVERVNAKSVKVRANTDRYGAPTPYPVNWTVSPQLLTVING